MNPLPPTTSESTILQLRRGLRPYQRRLWLRRLVRDGARIAAFVAAAGLVLAGAARLTPLGWAPLAAAAMVVAGLLALLIDAARVRPTLAETAMALDSEQGLRDRLASALALSERTPGDRPDAESHEALVRLQREDALRSLAAADRRAFRPRLPQRALASTVLCAALIVPALVLPNPQSAILAAREEQRDAAEQQARRLDQTADRLGTGRESPDPRADVADELRRLAKSLRDRPADLDEHLARLGSMEDALRSRLEPGAEQRAAAMTSLARSLSQLATGSDSNPAGDPQHAAEDLDEMAEGLDDKSPAEPAELARRLAEMEPVARQAGPEARGALHDAASALARGETAAAREALAKLGDALERGQRQVDLNRDLARAANDVQGARRALAGSGPTRAGQGGQPGQPGQPGSSSIPGSSAAPGQPGSSGQPGQPGQSGQPGQPGQGSQPGQGNQPGQGSQPGQGNQPGQGQGQGQGSLGGGGSNARYLGSGTGQGATRGPTTGNRQFGTGELDPVYADFDRLGRPGDPSYIAGSGGDGQIDPGSGQGAGTGNDGIVPYTDVYQEFQDLAITTLDRSYVPVDVKDYVRDYFSRLGGGP